MTIDAVPATLSTRSKTLVRIGRLSRRGFLLSFDALLGALVLVGGLVLLSTLISFSSDTSQLSNAGQDVMLAIGAISLNDLHDPWVGTCINASITASVSNCTISDANVTVLEQIGYFWASNQSANAQHLAEILLNSTYPSLGLRLSFDGTVIYERNSTKGSGDNIASSRMISGIAQGKAITGSSAVAYLRKIKDKRNAVFLPFGGFVGEGNISFNTSDIPAGANITDILLEADVEQPFNFIINGSVCDLLVPAPSPLSPSAWSRANCSSLIVPGGANFFSLKFAGNLNGSSVYGGYVKILYTTSQFNELNASNVVYQFPDIDGLINLYDGMYVGGSLSSMNISLHFLSNYTSYLTIGNASFSFAGSNDTQNRTINASDVQTALASAGLTFADISRKTVPLRFGIGEVIINGAPADIVVVTDTSGSMGWCVSNDNSPPCPANDLVKLVAAKNVTTNFITMLLNGSIGTRVGLAEFSTAIKSWHNLTTNLTVLNATVNAYTATDNTCICCGINNATNSLNLEGQVIYITRSSPGWKYNDTNLASPPAGWNTSSYVDTGWKNATTAIGWTYASLSTTIPAANRYQGSYYYRRTFNVSDASQIMDSKLFVYSDDGADVYLNGARIDNDYPNQHNAIYWNRNGKSVSKSLFVTGTNVIAVRQYHNGASSNKMGFNLELVANTKGNATTTQRKNIVLMSDGEANQECSQQNTGSATQDAIKAACDAYTNYGIIVYTVGFGSQADNTTLNAMANCTTGKFFAANNAVALQQAFSSIASTIIDNSNTQIAIVSGNVSRTVLYGDSVIRANYTPDVLPPQPNEISVVLQTPPLNMTNCTATVPLYNGMRFVDASVTSYSGEYWTSYVTVNGANVYNLSRYASVYSSVGDPYRIKIPASLLVAGNNTISMSIATDSGNASTNCSLNNTIIYTVAINLSTERSTVVEYSNGCIWNVSFADGTDAMLTIPTSYPGSDRCSYRPGNITYDDADAYQLGAYMIFSRMDFTHTGQVFVNLRAEDLEVIVTTISKVPYLWGPSIARLEVSR